VISAYHRLFEIEKSFRMSKHDLAARPIYHHKRESIEAHLSVVLAVGRFVEDRTGWSIKKSPARHGPCPAGGLARQLGGPVRRQGTHRWSLSRPGHSRAPQPRQHGLAPRFANNEWVVHCWLLIGLS
jgi:hypothetical protein